jgi:tRNA A37 threonylcarbamoyladenosine modification protein TsaB
MTTAPALALCASNATGDRPLSCALRTAAGIFTIHSTSAQRGDLTHLAAELCRRHGVTAADLRELRLDLGPGSYTGLRVAVTLARCLATFGALEVLTTDTLTLLAHTAGPQPTNRRLRPVLDARAGHLHDGQLRWHPTAPQQGNNHPHEHIPQQGNNDPHEHGPQHGNHHPHEHGPQHERPPRAIPTDHWLASLHPTDLILAPANLPAPLLATLHARAAHLLTPPPLDAATLFTLPLTPTPPHLLTPNYLLPSYADLPRRT